jgi:hypothetical protein
MPKELGFGIEQGIFVQPLANVNTQSGWPESLNGQSGSPESLNGQSGSPERLQVNRRILQSF